MPTKYFQLALYLFYFPGQNKEQDGVMLLIFLGFITYISSLICVLIGLNNCCHLFGVNVGLSSEKYLMDFFPKQN